MPPQPPGPSVPMGIDYSGGPTAQLRDQHSTGREERDCFANRNAKRKREVPRRDSRLKLEGKEGGEEGWATFPVNRL